jgi:hypothetical protein
MRDKPLDHILRKLILLGGRVGSPELREWASQELRGYSPADDLPAYRRVSAPIQIDGLVPGGMIHHETISVLDLPDFAQDEISESMPMTWGVHQIQSAVASNRHDPLVQLQVPGAALLAKYMNGTTAHGRVTAIYWSVSTVALEGVLDQIRTRLAELIAELRAATPSGQALPTAAQASNAVSVVVNGWGSRVSIAQASGGSSIVVGELSETMTGRPFWTRARTIGAACVGLATITGTVFAALQVW